MNKFVATFGEKKISVHVNSSGKASIDGKDVQFEFQRINHCKSLLQIGSKIYEVYHTNNVNDTIELSIGGIRFSPILRTAVKEKANEIIQKSEAGGGMLEIKSPMPGLLLKLNKKIGESVVEGDSVVVLEAMKMENDLRAKRGGTVKKILVKEGDSIEKGETILIIE